MVIEIFAIEGPNQKYPIFFSIKDIVWMDANTGEVRFQRGDYGVVRKIETVAFEKLLDRWRICDNG